MRKWCHTLLLQGYYCLFLGGSVGDGGGNRRVQVQHLSTHCRVVPRRQILHPSPSHWRANHCCSSCHSHTNLSLLLHDDPHRLVGWPDMHGLSRALYWLLVSLPAPNGDVLPLSHISVPLLKALLSPPSHWFGVLSRIPSLVPSHERPMVAQPDAPHRVGLQSNDEQSYILSRHTGIGWGTK
ncbi:hypothetical protein N7520_003329 [Penicillium odoratum]|uniref:uncharacterized protein n=1 Tax=Penicillium odoratum TaxID=1167516 RepID=UPI0025481B20|nr:uncharacterized protein N7520_003329 [Penicillium odoratum]KAJ5768770.1 hypothetical protein N7520_003329 [Penicillium odoratum]